MRIKREDVDRGRAEHGKVPIVGVEPLECVICVKPSTSIHLQHRLDMLEQSPGHLPRTGAGTPPYPYSRQIAGAASWATGRRTLPGQNMYARVWESQHRLG